MRFRVGLRGRFWVATLILVAIPLAGFTYAVHLFVEVLETRLLNVELASELARYTTAYNNDLQVPPPDGTDFKGYFVSEDEVGTLPARLAAVEANRPREIDLDGTEYLAGWRAVDGTRLYLLLNMEPVERLEARLVDIAKVCGVAALLLAAAVALWLSRLVTGPVHRLAERISSIQPGQGRAELHTDSPDHEIAKIAQAFERVVDRFDAFVARERAFTEDASHELRTPLATIISASQLIAADPALATKSHARLRRLQAAAGQMHELIEALLFLARGDDTSARACSVAEVVHEVVDTWRAAVDGSALSIEPTILEHKTVAAPYGLVLSVVSNVLGNAVAHTRQGVIKVILSNSDLVIEDTGGGIDPAALPSIFDRRYRGDHSHGHGLGLYIVKRVCERFGWRIHVHSTPETGTRVRIAFDAA